MHLTGGLSAWWESRVWSEDGWAKPGIIELPEIVQWA
jgi:hypothetical protein